MSSTAYSADIYPEAGLRRVVLVSGIALAALGAAAIALATIPVAARLPACLAWGVFSVLECRNLLRGWRRCHGIRIEAGGEMKVRDACGTWRSARLANGSVLLRRYGWLRLVSDDGVHVQELLRGHCRRSRDWRRLHVIWRHV